MNATLGELVAAIMLKADSAATAPLMLLGLQAVRQWVMCVLPTCLDAAENQRVDDFLNVKTKNARDLAIIGFFDEALERMQQATQGVPCC